MADDGVNPYKLITPGAEKSLISLFRIIPVLCDTIPLPNLKKNNNDK